MRKTTLKAIKKKADLVYSRYIRLIHADKNGNNTCVTCGIVKPMKEMQNGHYFERNRLGTRFHNDNCKPQCPACNVFKKGNYTQYAKYMYEQYGAEHLAYLEHLSRKPLKLTVNDYVSLIAVWNKIMDAKK